MELKQENVGKKLRILREIHNYTQAYVAEQLNVKQKAYSNLETGEVSLNLEKSEALAKLYKMDPIDFLSFLHATDKLVIHQITGGSSGGIMKNEHVTINNYALAEKEREIYEKKEALLTQEIDLLKEKMKFLEEKLNQLDTKKR